MIHATIPVPCYDVEKYRSILEESGHIKFMHNGVTIAKMTCIVSPEPPVMFFQGKVSVYNKYYELFKNLHGCSLSETGDIEC